MSSCQCCDPRSYAALEDNRRPLAIRPRLFNWISAVLLTGWVAIVALAFQFATPKPMSALPTLDVFLRSLLS